MPTWKTSMKYLFSASLLFFAATSLADEPKPATKGDAPERIALWNGKAPMGEGEFQEGEAYASSVGFSPSAPIWSGNPFEEVLSEKG